MLALGASVVSAQSASSGGFTREDIQLRDDLIAAQETLLNVYRCQFGLDIEVVPGGCTGGFPAQGFSRPAEFKGIPTSEDIAVRDRLVAAQETLLNTFRCRFDFEIYARVTPTAAPVRPSRSRLYCSPLTGWCGLKISRAIPRRGLSRQVGCQLPCWG